MTRTPRLLPVALTLAVGLLTTWLHAAGRDVTFFAIGDPQINIPRWGVAGTEQTIAMMNGLPGKDGPFGDVVAEPRGVLIAGDLVDAVSNPANWELYKQFFDPNGVARLRFPAFEGAGNHDLDTKQAVGTFTYVQQELIARNRTRPANLKLDPHGYHYSWDWDDVHFVCLNVFPGSVPRAVYDRDAPWNDPKGALAFLTNDLKAQVGKSGRPVVVFWHYGVRGWGLEKWWLPADLDALAGALKPYNIALIVHGHEHRYEHYTWNGMDVVMAPSTQFDPDPAQGTTQSRPKGFVVGRLTGRELQIGYRTPDGWDDKWRKPLGKKTTVSIRPSAFTKRRAPALPGA